MRELFLLLACMASSAFAQLDFFSVRTREESTFDVTLTFVVPEGAAQQVLIRDAGPALSTFGVSGTMVDPAIELSHNGSVLAANDNWGDSNAAALASAFSTFGAFSFQNNSKDAALLVTLNPGLYSVRAYSTTQSAGVILPELYTLGAGFQNVSISNRQPNPPENPIIAGFVASGGSYLVRALGPANGLGGAGNPSLQAFPGGTNDDWSNSADAAAIAAATTALGLAPLAPGSKDAALLMANLAGGGYTLYAANSGAVGVETLQIYNLAYATSPSAVPEPASFEIAGAVALGLLALSRRSKGSKSTP